MSRLNIVTLFNLQAEYIMQNAELGEAQAGIKIARRTINNLRYAVDTTLRAESEEELQSLLTKLKEESEKGGLNPKFKKRKIWSLFWHLVPAFHGTYWGINGNSDRLYFLGLQNHYDSECNHEIKRCLLLEGKL